MDEITDISPMSYPKFISPSLIYFQGERFLPSTLSIILNIIYLNPVISQPHLLQGKWTEPHHFPHSLNVPSHSAISHNLQKWRHARVLNSIQRNSPADTPHINRKSNSVWIPFEVMFRIQCCDRFCVPLEICYLQMWPKKPLAMGQIFTSVAIFLSKIDWNTNSDLSLLLRKPEGEMDKMKC